MMSPRAQIPTLSPSNSQSSSSCRSVEVVFSQLSQRQTGKQAQQHSQRTRAISISSDEENAPVFIAIDDPSSSSRGKGTGTARGGRARPIRKRVHNAEPADGVPNPQALKADEEDEEELHVIRFKHHLDSFKAPATSPASIRAQQRRTEVAAAVPFASSSETRFGPPSQQDASQARPLDLQRIKGEPSSQAFARSRLVKVEAEAAGVQSRSLLTMSSSQNSTRAAHQLPKIEIEGSDSFESEESRPRRPHDESTAIRPAGMASAGPIATDGDSITFSDTDADSSVDGQSKSVRERKKPSSNQTPSKAKGKAKAKTPKAAKITKPPQNPRTPRAAKSPKPAAEELPKPKVVKGPKPLPVDVSSIPNFVFSSLRTCPLCSPAHEFRPKQAPPTRRRHIAYCALARSLTPGNVEDILQQEMMRLEQLERLEFEQAEAAKTTFLRTIEESGLKLCNTKDDDVWRMLCVKATDPKRKGSRLTLAELASDWGQGGNAGTSRKKRRFGGPESLLKSHSNVRREIAERARELLEDFDDIQVPSLSQSSRNVEIDEDTGDILTEMNEEIFPFPADQRLAEERFTQALLPPASSFGSSFDGGGMALPPATQMPSSTFVSRSSSLLARRRPPVNGAGDGLFALFKRLEERKQEWEREEEQRKIEEGIAQRRAESIRRQREALAAAAAAAAAEAAAEGEAVASQEDIAEGDAEEGSGESWWGKRVRQMEELERQEQQEREEAERRRQEQEESWESSYVEEEEEEEEGEGEGRAEDDGQEQEDSLSPSAPPSSGAWKPFNSYTFEHS